MGYATTPAPATVSRSMGVAVCPVLTIGQSTHPLEAFVTLLRRYEVAKCWMSAQDRIAASIRSSIVSYWHAASRLAESSTRSCHHTLLIAQVLAAREVGVGHILADGGLETHEAAMERLLAIHGDAQQGELFLARCPG